MSVFDATANQLQAITKRCHRVANLVRQLCNQPPSCDEPVTLHEVGLQRGQPCVTIRQCSIRLTQLREPSRQRAPHVRKRRRYLIDFPNSRPAERSVEITGRKRLSRPRELLNRPCHLRRQRRA
jgi:hypothetical protein